MSSCLLCHTVEAGAMEVVVRQYTTSTIEVYWGDGSSLVTNFQGYDATIYPLTSGASRTVDAGTRQASFTNLQAGQLYTITVTIDGDNDIQYTADQRTSKSA